MSLLPDLKRALEGVLCKQPKEIFENEKLRNILKRNHTPPEALSLSPAKPKSPIINGKYKTRRGDRSLPSSIQANSGKNSSKKKKKRLLSNILLVTKCLAQEHGEQKKEHNYMIHQNTNPEMNVDKTENKNLVRSASSKGLTTEVTRLKRDKKIIQISKQKPKEKYISIIRPMLIHNRL